MAANPAPSRLNASKLSPNQLAKREAIVKAAAHLMGTEGVHACTSRAISQASGLSTSALHYYFLDIDEIFDLAIRSVIERFLGRMQNAAAAESNPIDALWAASGVYLRQGSEWTDDPTGRRAPMVWFEYQAEMLRKNDLDTVRELSERGLEIFRGLIEAAGLPHAERTARLLYHTLLGSVVRDSLFHREFSETLGEVSAALNIPASKKYCTPAKAKRG